MRKQAVKQAFEYNSMEVARGFGKEDCPMDRRGWAAWDRDPGFVAFLAVRSHRAEQSERALKYNQKELHCD